MDLTQIVVIVGYVVIGLHALRGVLMLVKGVMSIIPGDQGEAFVDKLDGYISMIENLLSKFVPVNTQAKKGE